MDPEIHTVALVEDDELLRESLAEILAASPKWQLTGVYPDAESAIEGMSSVCPEVVLMDIQLPGRSGIACVAKLKELHPDAQVLMVTVYDNNDRIFNALSAGASGYLLKRDAPLKLLDSLDELLSGGSPMSGAIARKVVQHFQATPPSKNENHNLTPREKQILELLVKGGLYKEIAWDLGIGVETVRTHLHNIYAKLHVRTRTEAVVKYLGRNV
ncbi:response regulator transcription factor [Luteolibacter flavescens]|uniref:Response regulator transcription factor n=1 Tax=Luteolibacter flavescens TaxID=1859460 RepID=A0ABT3FST0_9BACT|nr:response regulator transcription factor [Luteolibacter flavescens]MCW1886507.1 response regulator transcription factor [Luteolibacter flavescens]